MNSAKKVIALTMALTGGLLVCSYASQGDAQSYASKSMLKNLQREKFSGFSFTQLLQDSSRVETPDSIRFEEAPTIGLKKPYKAFLCALVPGAVLHGAGHFYAGKRGTGFVLLGSELVGATLVLVAAGMSWESGSVTREAFPVAFVGGALFFGSWIYDMVKSPLIVDKENRQLKKSQTNLRFRMDNTTLKLVMTREF